MSIFRKNGNKKMQKQVDSNTKELEFIKARQWDLDKRVRAIQRTIGIESREVYPGELEEGGS